METDSSNEGVEGDIKVDTSTSIFKKNEVKDTTNSNKDRSDKKFLSKFSKQLDKKSRLLFFKLGYFIAEHPFRTFTYALLGTMIVGVGIINYQEKNGLKVWIPQGTVSMKNVDRVDELYPADRLRITQIVLNSNSNDGNGHSVATKDGILSLVEVLEVLQQTTWKKNETYTYTYDELCDFSEFTRGISMCLTNSVLDIFFDADNVIHDEDDKVSFTGTIRAALDDMDDETVHHKLFDNPVTWEGNPFIPDFYIGLNGASEGATPDYAFRLNIAMTDTEDTQDHASYELEQEFERVVGDLDFAEFDVYISAFYAYEKAQQDQHRDVPLLMLGIIIAIVYICFTLGHLNAVESRLGLTTCAIFCIMLAYIATTGFCSLFSHAGPVHNMLPLLIVAIGIGKFVVNVTLSKNFSYILF